MSFLQEGIIWLLLFRDKNETLGFCKQNYFLCENCRWKKLKFQETVNFIPILTSNTTLNLVYDNINNILLQKIDDPKRDASKQNSSSAL